mgnify:CR=1
MKVLTKYEDLVGKTIAFSHMAQFADQITLVTTEGEVLMATADTDEWEDKEIRVFNKHNILNALESDRYLQEELSKLGIFDLEEYKKEQERKRKEQIELAKKQNEERERKQLAILKAKYESE